jgi:hypothetical protein
VSLAPLSIFTFTMASALLIGAGAVLVRARDLRRRRDAHSDLDLHL